MSGIFLTNSFHPNSCRILTRIQYMEQSSDIALVAFIYKSESIDISSSSLTMLLGSLDFLSIVCVEL